MGLQINEYCVTIDRYTDINMCGLVGWAAGRFIVDRNWFIGAVDALKHRGPDGVGMWWSVDGRVGLAHRRLSILDLSPAGHQPMHLAEHGLTIVFNGEIYNFHEVRSELEKRGQVFRSHSDTEVLLVAYGNPPEK